MYALHRLRRPRRFLVQPSCYFLFPPDFLGSKGCLETSTKSSTCRGHQLQLLGRLVNWSVLTARPVFSSKKKSEPSRTPHALSVLCSAVPSLRIINFCGAFLVGFACVVERSFGHSFAGSSDSPPHTREPVPAASFTQG
jgi:hypothetical protein